MSIDWDVVRSELRRHPTSIAAGGGDEASIAAAESRLACTFSPGYRAFLREIGGAIVGSDPIFGVVKADDMGKLWSVTDVTEHFRRQGWPAVKDWYVVSMEGRGNPVGVDASGRVWMSDHDVGDVVQVADSFEAFLEAQLGQ